MTATMCHTTRLGGAPAEVASVEPAGPRRKRRRRRRFVIKVARRDAWPLCQQQPLLPVWHVLSCLRVHHPQLCARNRCACSERTFCVTVRSVPRARASSSPCSPSATSWFLLVDFFFCFRVITRYHHPLSHARVGRACGRMQWLRERSETCDYHISGNLSALDGRCKFGHRGREALAYPRCRAHSPVPCHSGMPALAKSPAWHGDERHGPLPSRNNVMATRMTASRHPHTWQEQR